jgi:regulator of sigma E protease
MEAVLFWVVVVVLFVTMLTLLVAAHELGHYLFAKLFKMEVEEFAIGFGPKRLFTYLRKWGTDFTVRPFPLGGFVKVKGMVPEEDGSEIHVEGGFFQKPPWQRLIVLFAGPLFSVMAGLAILIPLYMSVGEAQPQNAPIVGGVAKGGPAEKAGLKSGDRFLSIAGKPVQTFYDVVLAVRDLPPASIELEVERNGTRLALTAVPLRDKEPTPVLGPDLEFTEERRVQSRLGMGPAVKTVPLAFGDAALAAVKKPVLMVVGLYRLSTTPSRIKDEVGGPLTIFAVTAETAKQGLAQYIALAGLLSIWLGIFNLLPIPGVFDGGHMFVAFVEMLRGGRRLSFRAQTWLATVGMTLVAILIVGVLAVDANRFLIKPFVKQVRQEESPK